MAVIGFDNAIPILVEAECGGGKMAGKTSIVVCI